MSRPNPAAVYRALLLLLALAGLDQTLLSSALPIIAADLHGQDQASWVFSAYLIASTVAIPLYGKLADRFGPRPLLLVAGSLFVAGSLTCAASPTMTLLVAARGLQGLGGGGLMTLTLLAVAELFPPEERARRQGLLGAAYGVATMLGPLVGGLLVQQLSWRWSLALGAPMALAAVAVLARARFGQAAAQFKPLDLAGAGLLASTLACLLMATRKGVAGTAEGWALLAAAGALGLAFAQVERRAADALIPFALFRDVSFRAAAALSLCSGVALFAAVVFLPMYLQSALGLSPTSSALYLLPLMLGLTVAAIACGRALRAGRSPRRLAMAAALAMVAAFAALAWVFAYAADAAWVYSLAVTPLGLGLGLMFPILSVVSQRSAAPRHVGIATATPIMLRALGGALGVSALGALVSQGMQATVITSRAGFASALAGNLQSVYEAVALVALAGLLTAFALPRRLSTLPVQN